MWKHQVLHQLLCEIYLSEVWFELSLKKKKKKKLNCGLTEAVVLVAAVDGRELHRGKILAAPLAVQLGPQLALSAPLPRQSLVLTQLQRWIL